jgi:chromosome segregation ATPase
LVATSRENSASQVREIGELKSLVSKHKQESEGAKKDLIEREKSLQLALFQITSLKTENKKLTYEIEKIKRKHTQDSRADQEAKGKASKYGAEEIRALNAKCDTLREELKRAHEKHMLFVAQSKSAFETEMALRETLQETILSLQDQVSRVQEERDVYVSKLNETHDSELMLSVEKFKYEEAAKEAHKTVEILRESISLKESTHEKSLATSLKAQEKLKETVNFLRANQRKVFDTLQDVKEQFIDISSKHQAGGQENESLRIQIDKLISENEELVNTSMMQDTSFLVVSELEASLESAKKVEEDLLNELENVSNENLDLRQQLAISEAKTKELESICEEVKESAFKDIQATVSRVQQMQENLVKLSQENKHLNDRLLKKETIFSPTASVKIDHTQLEGLRRQLEVTNKALHQQKLDSVQHQLNHEVTVSELTETNEVG